jgi:hypothetical protein
MSYMTLILRMRNCSVHSMPLERRHNFKGQQESGGEGGANMSTMVVHLKNKVACLEGCGGQARKGRKALPCKQGLTRAHGHRRANR